MINLVIDNSTSNISGLSMEQSKELRKIVSYTIDAQAMYFSGNFRSNRVSLISKKGDFPTGLLHMVENYIKKSMLKVSVVDRRKKPKSLKNFPRCNIGITPYPEQAQAMLTAVDKHRGIICMPTGFGKSVTMALLINSLKVKVLIVVPNLTLKQQLTESMQKWFGKSDDIIIENIDSPFLPALTDFDCIILDEAHHAAAKTYRKLNKDAWNGIYYRFFFTATPFRTRDEDNILLESIAGQVIYKVDYKTAVDKGYIVKLDAFYIELPKKEVEGYTWHQVYTELVVANEYRNKLIAKLLNKLSELGPTLCIVKEIIHGDTLSNAVDAPFASGDNGKLLPLLDAFNRQAIPCLIGTAGVLGEGCDTKPAEWVVIAGLGKSRGSFMQQVGRALRAYKGKESAKVIVFLDKSHKWTRAHFKAQVKHLKDEYGVTPKKLDYRTS